MKTSKSTGFISTTSKIGNKNGISYKIIVSIIFGLFGFFLNFHSINFPFPPYTATILIGLLFPMLIAITWGWKYGLLSALAGGCQSMWWLWGSSNGYAIFFAVPPFTLWIAWHGYFADLRRKRKRNDWWLNPYIVEIPFRLLSSINLFTLVRWAIKFNPPPWRWAYGAPDTIPMRFSNFVVIKQFVVGYIILLLADVLLNFGAVRRFFRLREQYARASTGYVISGSLLLGGFFWIIDSALGSLIFHAESSFLDLLALNIPPYILFVRIALILTCLVGGIVASNSLHKQRLSEKVVRESEAQKQALLDGSPDMIILVDTDLRVLWANRTALNMSSNSVGQFCYKAFPGLDEPCKGCPIIKAAETGKMETGIMHQDAIEGVKGESYWEDIGVPLKDESGNVTSIIKIARNITDRLQHEKDLLKRTEEINTLYEASQQIGRSLDLQLVCDTLYSLIENVMDCDGMLVSRYDAEDNLIHCIYARVENESYDATKFPPIPLEPEGQGTQSIAIRAGEPLIISDWDRQVKHAGKRYYAGENRVVSEEELPDGAKHTRSALIIPMKLEDEVFGVIQVSSYRLDAYTSDDLKLLSAISVQVSSSVKNAILYETAQREITQRQKVEEALNAEKERLIVTLRSIGDAVIATDIDGRIILMNGVAENLTGWNQEDAVGKHLSKIFCITDFKTGKKYLNSFEDIISTGGTGDSTSQTVLKGKDGLERPIAYVGAPIRNMESDIIGVVLVFRDIMPQLKMEEELQQASRLESIGLLAGGLAHDFNNLLTAILGNVSLAKILLNPGSDEYKILEKAENASGRAKDLTQQLLTFSKGGIPIKKAASIAGLIRETAEFALGGSKSRCDLSIPEDLWPVEMDEGQISQVIENLIINADQAMPDGGIVRITAKNTLSDEVEDPFLKNGRYISISIADKGIGIPDGQIEKIFDPYYTTKQKGSGLGLSIVYSIIKKHDGRITVESAMGIGTTFRVLLPATQKEAVKESERKRKIFSIKGNILIMDDEEIVLDVAKAMLERFGCTVEVASDGNEVVRKYRESLESGNFFNAVILDLTIPGGMGGKQTIIQLLNIDPEVKAIVSSGYSNDPVMANYSEYGFVDFMVKPFSSLELNRKIRKILNSK